MICIHILHNHLYSDLYGSGTPKLGLDFIRFLPAEQRQLAAAAVRVPPESLPEVLLSASEGIAAAWRLG